MSIFADWALRVSLTRMGSASALISWSLPLLSGYSTTLTAVTFPPETVICTWTGPQRVLAAVRVTVVVPAELAPDDDGAVDVPEDDVPEDDVPEDDVPDDVPVPD